MNPITAVICTKDRGVAIRAAAESVLASDHPNFKLLVFDQSRDDSSERALDPLRGDPRLVYVRSGSVGLSRARNEALRRSETELVAYTDDDCEVPKDWLRIMQEVMEEHPRAALVFCNVDVGPHDKTKGFVPGFTCSGTRLHTKFTPEVRGMGAGLAVQRQTLLDLGGFDEELGAGARFPSCEDRDVVVRALLANRPVCTTDRTFVIHLGFRTWQEGKTLGKRDFVGIGAACAKPILAGHWSFLPMAMHEIVIESLLSPLSEVLRLRRPRGLGRTLYFMRGFVGGALTRMDRKHLVYAPADTQRTK